MEDMTDCERFKSALLFLHVAELKGLCDKLSLPEKGNKGELIHRIAHFVKTGEVIRSVPIPKESRVSSNKSSTLAPDSYILYGVYKNDLKTRLFFKKMIGDYFHFTAFGIDWIKERWLEGNPPTYREFADFWTTEYTRREKGKKAPKQEWAYINFIQDYIQNHPNASREEIISAWEDVREKNLQFVYKFLERKN